MYDNDHENLSIRPMMSVHLIDTGWPTSVRRKLPNIAEVAGLRSIRKAVAAPFTGKHVPGAQPGRGGFIAFWDDLAALDDFDEWHPAAREFRNGFRVRAEPLNASGAWPGLSVELPRDVAKAHEGPVLGLSIGNVRLSKFGALQKRNIHIERQVIASPSFVWGTALAGTPRLLATLSMWDSAAGLTEFARTGAHRDGIRDSVLAERPANEVPFQSTTFFSESAFLRCRVVSITGGLQGRNSVSETALAAVVG